MLLHIEKCFGFDRSVLFVLFILLYELICPAFSAFIPGIDAFDHILHGIDAEEIPGFLYPAVKCKLSDLCLRTLGQYDHLVEQIRDTVRLVCDDQHHLALAGDHAQILHQLGRHDAIQTGIRLVQNEKMRGGNKLHADRKPLLLTS